MSSFKQDTPLSRPPSQHRTSLNSVPSANLPIRNSTSRQHSHTVTLGTNNSSHRVTRRKSMTSGVFNSAAILRAAVNGDGENAVGNLVHVNRRSLPVKQAGGTRAVQQTPNDADGDMGDEAILMDTSADISYTYEQSAVVDSSATANSLLPPGKGGLSSKPRVRRASEGSHLSKGDGKRVSGELRCEKCGKGYKHSSCLTKHLWEHTPEWSYTSKLLISKHQQVQLLEAASVLVGMNQDAAAEAQESGKLHDSDHSSASPAASGTSEIQDDYLSSAETTPPPTSDHFYAPDSYSTIREKRYSGNSSSFSRSYQSTSSVAVGSVPSLGLSYGSHRGFSNQRRPSTSGIGAPRSFGADEDEAGLAAAVESLCSFGTPRSGATHLPADIPPVPPLPAQYAAHNRLSGTIGTPIAQPAFTMPPSSFQRVSNERGLLTKERQDAPIKTDDGFGGQIPSRSRDDDEDEMMFGRDEIIY